MDLFSLESIPGNLQLSQQSCDSPTQAPCCFPNHPSFGDSFQIGSVVYEPFVYTSRTSTHCSVWSFANLLINVLVLVT